MTEHTMKRTTGAQTRDWLRLTSVVLAIVGAFVAAYLSYVELVDVNSMVCPSHGSTIFGLQIDCGMVNASPYAKIGPLPVALLGLGGYIAILGVLLLKRQLSILEEYGHFLFFGLTLFGFAFSIYLTWAEVAQIRAFCTWCMASAAIMTLLFVIALVRLWQKMNEEII